MKYLKTLVLVGMLALGASVNGYALESTESTETTKSSVVAMAQVNLNTASAAELAEKLVGVGEKRAQAIVALREQLGGFKHPEQLMDVKGIGEATFEKNKAFITL